MTDSQRFVNKLSRKARISLQKCQVFALKLPCSQRDNATFSLSEGPSSRMLPVGTNLFYGGGTMNFVMKIATAAALTLFAGAANAATLLLTDLEYAAEDSYFGIVTCDNCRYLDDTADGTAWYVDNDAPTSHTFDDTTHWVEATDAGTVVGDLWHIDPNANSEENEVNAFNTITENQYSLDYTTFTKTEFGSGETLTSYTSVTDELIIFKFGGGGIEGDGTHLFVWNEAGSTISYDGRALSHVTIGEIPLPAAGFLLLGGLGGLAIMRRRKKA